MRKHLVSARCVLSYQLPVCKSRGGFGLFHTSLRIKGRLFDVYSYVECLTAFCLCDGYANGYLPTALESSICFWWKVISHWINNPYAKVSDGR
jgi:hypothetical protein